MDKKPEIKPLTGIRGVLAIWVVIFHIFLFLTLAVGAKMEDHFGDLVANIFWRGYFAVDIFFLLSGFVISYSYAERLEDLNKTSYSRYIFSRLLKIYPVHLFVLLVFALFYWGLNLPLPDKCFPHDSSLECSKYSFRGFIENLFLIQSWNWFPLNNWNVVAWSISSEFFAYLIFPFLLVFLNKINKVWLLSLTIFFLISIMLFVLSSSTIGSHYYSLFSELVLTRDHSGFTKEFLDSPNQVAFEFGIVRVFFEFIVGCLIYRIFEQVKDVKIKYISVYLYLVIFLIIMSFNYGGTLMHYYLAPFLILLLSLDKSSYLSKLLSLGFFNWLGKISYSTYMIQVVLLSILAKPIMSLFESESLYSSGTVYLASIIIVVATVISGGVVYYVIENPAIKFLRGKPKDD